MDNMYNQITEEYLNLGWMEEELKIEQLSDVLSNYVYLPHYKLDEIAERIVKNVGESEDEDEIKDVICSIIDEQIDDIRPLS